MKKQLKKPLKYRLLIRFLSAWADPMIQFMIFLAIFAVLLFGGIITADLFNVENVLAIVIGITTALGGTISWVKLCTPYIDHLVVVFEKDITYMGEPPGGDMFW